MPDVSFLEKRMKRREFIKTTAASAVRLMLDREASAGDNPKKQNQPENKTI